MLINQEIVFIANDWVRDNKTSAHHIAEVLARTNRVLYVEGAGMRAPRASRRDLGKIVRKLRSAYALPRSISESMYLYSPTVLPFHGKPAVGRLNEMLLEHSLGRACRHVGFSNPLLWIFMPHFGAALRAVPHIGSVYSCVDDYASQPLVDPAAIRAMEREIVRQVDVVFAVSEELVRARGVDNPHTFLSRHGVDIELFRRASDAETPVPDDVRGIKGPIAGYFGLIEEWVDLDLVAHLARALPDVSFVMIGRVTRDVAHFNSLENVHFLGARPYESLPGYLKAFDACMLLYKPGGFATNANPKKLREYLAGGKPVVSVRLGEVERYANVVRIADSYDDFVRELRASLSESDADRVQERQSAVESESWEAKVERLGDIVMEHVPLERSVGRAGKR